MSLIKCFECKREVSDRAIFCPHCGFPISEEISSLSEKEKIIKYLLDGIICFDNIDDKFKNDRDIVKVAVSLNPNLLQSVNDNFKDDKEIVKNAVKLSSNVIRFASERLQKDDEILLIFNERKAKVDSFKKKLIGEIIK